MIGIAATAGGVLAASAAAGQAAAGSTSQPIKDGKGAPILGQTNPPREAEEPDTLRPPETDHGTIPNLKWSFTDSHMRLEEGGWARQVTTRELPISKEMAGVNMRLKTNACRELHWHKEAEWSYMLKGRARITAVDSEGRTFIDDVGEGDLWYFPGGTPHSIQGLAGPEDGCEFLLVFDEGDFSEDSTFLLTDWMAHTPRDVLAKNFGVPESALEPLPKKELYIFPAAPPSPTLAGDSHAGEGKVPQTFSHRMTEQAPIKSRSGTVRITDTKLFPASKTISAALVELERRVHNARRSGGHSLTMPITVHLDDMLARRRMSLTELSQAVDITLANLSILKTGKAKAVRFSTLEAICAVLDCQPGELLSFQADDPPDR